MPSAAPDMPPCRCGNVSEGHMMKKLGPVILLAAASCSSTHEPGQVGRGTAFMPPSSVALLNGLAGRAGGALTGALSGSEAPPPPPPDAAPTDPQPAHALAYQPVLQTHPAETPLTAPATLPLSLQTPLCASQQIRTAMLELERAASQDRSGAALQSLVHAFTGVNASSSVGKVVDSGTGSDGGRYTAEQPGSFICRGVFTRETARAEADDSNASASVTAALGTLMSPPPNFVESFLVQPLQSDSFRLTLLPSTIEYSHPYSTDFTVPGARQAG